MAAAWRAVCLCAQVSECESAHMYVCVCFIDLSGGWVGGGGEIYLSEQRRIGDREERGEGCAEKKKNDLKEKGKCRRERFIVE